MTYSEKLKDPRWQKKRLKVLERDDFTCQVCGDDKKTLHVHHKKYSAKNPYDEPMQNLLTLCCYCHQLIEFAEINPDDIQAIVLFPLKDDCGYIIKKLSGNLLFINIIDKKSELLLNVENTDKFYNAIEYLKHG